MAGRTMNNPILSRALAALLLLAAPPLLSGCGPARETPPLADAKIGGPFTLTDQDGRKVSDGDFAGKYRLIYFGYTFCPDVCPVDVQTLMKGYRKVEASNPALAAKIQPIFITVDPARDTPAVLKQFVRAFHPKLIGLTGSEAEIAAVAKEFAIYYKKQQGSPGTPGYLVDHSRQAMLFDPQGKPLALVAQDKDADTVAADIERWAR
ncbi:SCO family protein [Rhizorhabdus wittichii]|uniref:Electron transport protein SCO1/SenC n=2 Tax=Rhizorhabdus wittichii TaxID=160791 RepID=A0A9J9HCR7_RHIWR|nr:SCO family protein [Rhizorhabdus wittichii]ABQ69173.1 electron transport protein SCO1/SenC [Rhizorhabdus wittichii RW1]ARR53991.1 SCO family protein [Rhizorhabdus wittichii DC-6]QTH20439.1 SCO family protein [Rhizorhabdus wittichii]